MRKKGGGVDLKRVYGKEADDKSKHSKLVEKLIKRLERKNKDLQEIEINYILYSIALNEYRKAKSLVLHVLMNFYLFC